MYSPKTVLGLRARIKAGSLKDSKIKSWKFGHFTPSLKLGQSSNSNRYFYKGLANRLG